MDIVPTLVEGAVVINLVSVCPGKQGTCAPCSQMALLFHNWVKGTKLNYLVFDFQDEKALCPTFLEELVLMRKRLRFPLLFSGVMEQSRRFLEQYNCTETYPLFMVPEDAIRALRMQHPGLTESLPEVPILFDHPLSSILSADEPLLVDEPREEELQFTALASL